MVPKYATAANPVLQNRLARPQTARFEGLNVGTPVGLPAPPAALQTPASLANAPHAPNIPPVAAPVPAIPPQPAAAKPPEPEGTSTALTHVLNLRHRLPSVLLRQMEPGEGGSPLQRPMSSRLSKQTSTVAPPKDATPVVEEGEEEKEAEASPRASDASSAAGDGAAEEAAASESSAPRPFKFFQPSEWIKLDQKVSAGEDVEMGELRMRIASLKRLIATQKPSSLEVQEEDEGTQAESADQQHGADEDLQALIDALEAAGAG